MQIRIDDNASAKILEIDLDVDDYIQIDVRRHDGSIVVLNFHVNTFETSHHVMSRHEYNNLDRFPSNIDHLIPEE